MEVSQILPEGMTGVRNKTQALYVHTLPVIRYQAEIVSWPQLGMDATHVRTCNSLQYTEGSSQNIQQSETLQAKKEGGRWFRGFHDPRRNGEHIQHQEDWMLPYFFRFLPSFWLILTHKSCWKASECQCLLTQNPKLFKQNMSFSMLYHFCGLQPETWACFWNILELSL